MSTAASRTSTSERASPDPTGTKTLREHEFRPQFTTRLRALKGALRATIVENDALDLKESTPAERTQQALYAAAEDIDPTQRFAFNTDAGAVDEFLGWLDIQLEEGVLERTSREQIRNGEHYTARYIRSAASRGWNRSLAEMEAAGYDVDRQAHEQAFNAPRAQEQLELAYTRTFDEVADTTADIKTALRRKLTEGLSQGWNARKIAREMNGRIDAIGYTDLERLARTEVIRSYNEFALTGYERLGLDEVTAEVELNTAGDNRV